MSNARNGEVSIYYDEFGERADPTLVLVNGLGSQCINYPVAWCEMFVAAGFHVVRMDNRDVGLSSKCEGIDYTVHDMANDVIAVLDAVGADRSHVMGCSMGGMIVQQLAIDHPTRLLSVTSVMSRTGEPGFGESSPEALAVLMAKPATSRSEYVDRQVAAQGIYGSKPEWIDEQAIRDRSEAAFDRCFSPAGIARQMAAVGRGGARDVGLREVNLPVLVMHGSRDTLIAPSGGRHTADVIPGAEFHLIEGMGHDYPAAVWDEWVTTWSKFVARRAG